MANPDNREITDILAILEGKESKPDTCVPIIENPDLVGYYWFFRGEDRKTSASVKVYFSDEQRIRTPGVVYLSIPLENIVLSRCNKDVGLSGDDVVELSFSTVETLSPVDGLTDALRSMLDPVDVPLTI